MKTNNKVVCSVMAAISLITGGLITAEVPIDDQAVGQVIIDGTNLGEMRVSPTGLALIGNAESCRLEPYICPAGLITNGIGNTHAVPKEPVTIEQVAKDWVKNIQSAENCLVASAPDKPMSQGQIDAFTSFIFNTGCTRFRHNRDGSETLIYSKIKKGQYNSACAQLKRWVRGGGRRLPGLVVRRTKETEVCLAH